MGHPRPLLAALLLLCVPAAADVHPNSASGFASGGSFQAGETDSINLFNGSLLLTLPIGHSYPVGGGLGYGLTLVYSSTPWDFQQRLDEMSGVTYNQAYPGRRSNAGIGWRLSPGRLLMPHEVIGGVDVNDSPRWIYQAPDGSEHVFYDRLHQGDAEDAGDGGATQNVTYTRDGSYLRMKVVGGFREIEFPDGTIHRFGSDRLLSQIRNRFSGNTVAITYGNPWTITDSHGRVQKVHFKTLSQDNGTVDVVDRVELTGFGALTGTYTFSYSAATVRRPCPHNDPVLSTNVSVQLLTGVTLPDGSAWSMAANDYVIDAPGSGVQCRASGSIRGLRLPTLGRIEWSYAEYEFPSQSSNRPYRQIRAGVGTRTTRDASGSLLGQWTYAPALTPPPTPPPYTYYEELVNTVTDPLGNRRVHYFSVYAGGGASSFQKEDYSLPFSRNASDGAGRFASVRIYDAAGTLVRSAFARYQRDQLTLVGDTLQDQINLNRREQSARTVFHDDAHRYIEANRSNFDGLGHYRQTQTGGNFPSGDSRTVVTAFNPAAGTYELGANGLPLPGFNMPGSASPWVLGTYTDQTATEGSSTERALFCFDADTGFLERQRALKNPSAIGADDVLVVYTADTNGNLASEAWHGGDNGGLSTTDTCSFTPPAADYRMTHTWQYGALATSKYAGASFFSVDRTIDSRTGLPASSRDSAGLQTDYEYDAMGRPTWEKPPAGHGSWVEHVYLPATSAASLAKVIHRRRGNGSKTAGVIAPTQVHFDAMGRVWKELTFLPGLVWSVRETLYNGAGWTSQVSEAYSSTAAATNWTKLLDHDPFGRPRTVRPPDGQAHDVTLGYAGVRTVSRTAKVGTSWNGSTVTEEDATTTEIY